MSKVFIMVGGVASGKSTLAKMISKEYNAELVSRDSIRFSCIKGNDAYFAKEKMVFEIYTQYINAMLDFGHNVIADATHLNWPSRYKLLKALKLRKNDEIIIVKVDTALEKAIERNAKRVGRERVPDDALVNMYNKLTDPAEDGYPYTEIWEYQAI